MDTATKDIQQTASPRNPRTARWLPMALVAAAFLGLGALLAFGVPLLRNGVFGDSSSAISQKLGLKPAPDFTAPLYSGGEGSFTLSEQTGHPVVLNFWASWCPPCRAEFPALQAASDKYAGQGVIVFGAAVQDTEADAKAFLKEQGTTFKTGLDQNGKLAVDYTVTGLPATYFITRDGYVYKKWVGEIDEQRLDTFIQELLQL